MDNKIKEWLQKKLPEDGYKNIVFLVESQENEIEQLTKQVKAQDDHAKQDIKRQTYLKSELDKAKEKVVELNRKLNARGGSN